MKVIVFCTLALSAVLGLAIADDMSYGQGFGGAGYGRASYGGAGYGGASYGGAGYGGASYGGGVAYMPMPAAAGGSSGFGLGSLLPLLFLCFLMFGNQSSSQDRIILVNSSLTG